MESLEDRRLLAVVTVNTTTDVDDGDTSSITALIATPGADGAISLREAITAANITAGADTVELPAGTYSLTMVGANEDANATGDLDVTEALTLVGDDAENTIIVASGLDPDGAGAAFGDRVFQVHGVVFNLQNVTIAGGNVDGDGGGLLNDRGSVTLTDVIVDGNASTGSGGGLATFGSALIPITLTLDHARVSNNEADTGGGGVYSSNDTLNINSSEIRDNQSHRSGGGIEIVADSISATTLNMANSSVSGNVADIEGGGIAGFGEMLNIRDSVINDNTAIGNGGGILNNAGDLDLLRSTLDNNEAGSDGGGIFNVVGTSDIAETTLSVNEAGGNGGAIANSSGTVNVRNSTISGNAAADDGQGGGIQNSGTFNLLNTTLTANQAGHGAGLNISLTATSTLLGNTVVAANTNIESSSPGDIFGTVDSTSSSNLIGDGSNLSGISDGSGGNQVGTTAAPIDPMLGPLGFNGGPNFTHLLLTGSPAIDAGDNSIAPPIDQRGGHRPLPPGGDVDIGAVELQTGCSTEVTTAADSFDAGDGETSLREAIVCANLTVGPDDITFNIPTAGVQTINVGSTGLGPLPDITEAVTIDGYTQGGTPNSDPFAFNGELLIEINGASAGEIANGLEIHAGSTTVRGLVINRFRSQRIGNETFGGNAIVLTNLGGNLIEGNVLGTNPGGTIELGNESTGILINGPSNNTIGGTTPAARNVISSNLIGIEIEDGSTGNIVLGNLIGTNAAGTSSLSIASAGIGIYESSGNTIGGTTTESRNVISGNAVGIYLIADELAATDNMLQGNYIGTDVTGVGDVGNDIGVLIGAGGNLVGGTSVSARNVISGNDVTGLVIGNFTSRLTGPIAGNLVQGNFIGISATADAPLPNGGGDFDEIAARFNQVILEATGESPDVTAGQLAAIESGLAIARATGNTIGGTAPGAGNVISGNEGAGVILAGAVDNFIQGNLVGTNASGTAALANNGHGVFIQGGSNNLIGGDTAAARNVLSGNLGSGVELWDNAAGNRLFGNFIGVDASGDVGLGNGEYGVGLYNAQDNLIGDATPTVGTGRGNVISGNSESGVEIDSGVTSIGDPSSGNRVRGNVIGLTAAGTSDVGNLEQGVAIINSLNNTIGGPSVNDGNLISANALQGVYIASENVGNAAFVGASNNLVQNNGIGTDITETLDRGNGAAGVTIFDANNNTVRDNVIAFNSLPLAATGIEVQSGMGNVFLQNSIFNNPGLGIDLRGGSENVNGVTANDPTDADTGANNLQNYPVLTSAVTEITTVVQGTFNSLPDRTFRIEFFSNNVPDPSGFGEGRNFLGFQNLSTDSSGDASIDFVSPVLVPTGRFITSTATLVEVVDGEFFVETSEFSNAIEVAGPPITLADLSLSKAVDDARPNVGDEITFTLTLSNDGPDDATGIEVTDLLPAGLGFVDASQDSYNPASGVWTVATLPFDETEMLTITAVVIGAGTTTNVAEVTASDQPDPSPDEPASAIITPQRADLSLVKTVDNSAAAIGETVTFTIAVNNLGPDAATGVTVADQLPEGLQFLSAMTETGNYDSQQGVWTVGQLADGATATLEIVATLSTEQSVTNTAEIATSDQFDPDPDDDQFSVVVGACLTGGPLTAGMNRFVYSCVTPGGFAAFVMGTQEGSHYFDKWDTTVDIANPSVPAIGIGNIDGVATVLIELNEQQARQGMIFQAFEMVPNPKLSNTLTLNRPDDVVGVPLHAADVGLGGTALSVNTLPALTGEAIARWEATGLSEADARLIRSLEVRISDLPGDQLAASHGNFVLVDSNAVWNGWFVDVTPSDDTEFSTDAVGERVATSPAATDRIDLLTVLMHEMGHVLGHDDVSDGSTSELMSRGLPIGVRRLPTSVYDPLDANRDGKVSALDALVIINGLARERSLPQASGESLTGNLDQVLKSYDVNRDGRVSALDALNVINHMSRSTFATDAESEQGSRVEWEIPSLPMLISDVESLDDDDLIRMLADDNINAQLGTNNPPAYSM